MSAKAICLRRLDVNELNHVIFLEVCRVGILVELFHDMR